MSDDPVTLAPMETETQKAAAMVCRDGFLSVLPKQVDPASNTLVASCCKLSECVAQKSLTDPRDFFGCTFSTLGWWDRPRRRRNVAKQRPGTQVGT